MKWKISNTLFVVAIAIFALGVLFNWMQVRNSVETSLEKARRVKKEKAEARKKAQEQEVQEDDSYIMEVDELDQEIETIINKNNNGK
tara:strand:- start:235 stop:495 length:261 start_codon:yes stop_codon:yes gene_type:complete